jgi:hypothetical protein
MATEATGMSDVEPSGMEVGKSARTECAIKVMEWALVVFGTFQPVDPVSDAHPTSAKLKIVARPAYIISFRIVIVLVLSMEFRNALSGGALDLGQLTKTANRGIR